MKICVIFLFNSCNIKVIIKLKTWYLNDVKSCGSALEEKSSFKLLRLSLSLLNRIGGLILLLLLKLPPK